jgi:WD40 repeat protein
MECVEVGVFEGHIQLVAALALLSFGRLAAGGWDKTVGVWQISTQQRVATLRGHDDRVISLAVVSDNQLASGSADCTVRIWNTATYEWIRTLRLHDWHVSAQLLLPNGTLACSSGKDIKIWKISTQTCITKIKGHKSYVFCLCILPTEQFVSGSDDNTIRVWSMSSQKCEVIFRGHTKGVRVLAVLPAGPLVSGSDDKTIRIWNLSNRRCDFTLRGHEGSVSVLTCLQNGHLVSGSADKTVRIWDAAAGDCKVTLPVGGSICSLISMPDGTFATGSGDGKIQSWQCILPSDQLTISEVISSSLLTSYAKKPFVVAPGRSFRKRVVNIWYNMNGAASWIHNLRGYYVQQSRLHHVLQVPSSPSAVDFDKYFVNLALIRHVDHVTREKGLVIDRNAAMMSLDRGELYDRLFMEHRYCSVESIFDDLQDRNQEVGWVKIVGRAGTGKTTLTHYLAYRWAQKSSLWDNRFDVVFRVKLNLVSQEGVFEPRGSGLVDLVALIFASLDRSALFDRETIQYFLESRPLVTLILLDGFDEIVSLYSSNIRVKGLVDSALNLPNGILTSRPLKFPSDWEKRSAFRQTYENIGLCEENVCCYIDQYFAATDISVKDSLLGTLKRNPNLMKLAQIPVNLNAMCSIWQEQRKGDHTVDDISTVTSVYDRMVLAVLRHAKLKQSVETSKYELSDDFLRKENGVWLCELSRLAHQAFEADQTQTIGPDLLRKYLQEYANDPVKLLSVFRIEWGLLREVDAVTSSSSPSAGLSAHYFVHLTYQEYFIALYLVDALVPNGKMESLSERREYLRKIQVMATKIRENLHNPRYEMIWIFVAGLLSRSPYLEFADYYWDALLPEDKNTRESSSRYPSHSSASSSIPNEVSFLGVHPTSSTVSTYGRLIREAVLGMRGQWEELPSRLVPLQIRLKLVLHWQLFCEDRGLIPMGDHLTNSVHEIKWRLYQHESRRKQLLYDLNQLGGDELKGMPWSSLRGYDGGQGRSSPKTTLTEDPLVSCLASLSKWKRLATIEQLCSQPCPESVNTLLLLSEYDEDMSVRAMSLIAWCLQKETTQKSFVREVTEKLDEVINSTAPELRRSAVLLVGARALQRPPEEQTQILAKLQTVMKREDKSPHVRLTLSKLLIMLDNDMEAVRHLTEALWNQDSNLRLEALLYLKEISSNIGDKATITHLLTTISAIQFSEVEYNHLAVALRRIRPEIYGQLDDQILSSGFAARGFVESLWIHMGSSVHTTPELRHVEDELIAALSKNGDVAFLIKALREPLSLPLMTKVFEESFVSETLKCKVLRDSVCSGNANLGTSIAGLHLCCEIVEEPQTLELALFGPGPCLTMGMHVPDVSVNDVREAVVDCGNELDAITSWATCLKSVEQGYLVALRLYTLVNPPIFKLLNYPFYNPDNRDPNRVLNQLPYMKYLLRSFDAVYSSGEQFTYSGPAFRGVNVHTSDLLANKYSNWRDHYSVGRKLTFPSFTSVSLDMTTAEAYAQDNDRIIFKFTYVSGLRLGRLSSEVEQEVLLKPPVVFVILAVAMEVSGTLCITLEMDLTSPLAYM